MTITNTPCLISHITKNSWDGNLPGILRPKLMLRFNLPCLWFHYTSIAELFSHSTGVQKHICLTCVAQRDACSSTSSYAPIGVTLHWLHLELHTCSGSMWASILVWWWLIWRLSNTWWWRNSTPSWTENWVPSCELSQLVSACSPFVTQYNRSNMV